MKLTILFRTLLVTASPLLLASALQAQVVYNQSFDYDAGDNGKTFTDANFPGEGWSSGTGVITYQHTAGLSYTGLTSAGGALQYDFTGGTGNRSASQAFSSDLVFGDYAAGQVFTFTALMRVDRALNSGATISLSFDGNNVVNRPRFILTETAMVAEVWANGALSTVSGPGYTVGDTLAFHMELVKGTTDTNNVVSIWFNPVDLSSLGAANFVSTSDTRFGRSTGILTGVICSGGTVGDTQWTIDEVNVTAVPEPATYAIFAGLLALGLVYLRRRL